MGWKENVEGKRVGFDVGTGLGLYKGEEGAVSHLAI